MKLRKTAIALGVGALTSILIFTPKQLKAENVQILYKNSIEKYENRNYKGAIYDLDKAIQLNKDIPQLFYNRGVIKEQEFKDYSGAIEDYKKAINLNPQYIDAYVNLGISKRKIGDEKGSCISYIKAISLGDKPTKQWLHSKDGIWCKNMADSYIITGINKAKDNDYVNAIKDFNSALEIDPNNILALSIRGLEKSKMSDYQGAIKDYNKILEIKPDDFQTYNDRGIVKRFSLDPKGAIQDFKKALKFNPEGRKDYYFNIALAKTDLRDYEGAILIYNKLIQEDKHDSTLYQNRGRNKIHLKDFISAAQDLNKAIEIDPNDFFKYRWRGEAKKGIGDLKGACKDWSIATNLGDTFNGRKLLEDHCK